MCYGRFLLGVGLSACWLGIAMTVDHSAAKSTSLLKVNEWLQGDWVYRFNQNPNDFEPDSGAYIPDPPLSDEDIYAITAYMMTFQ